MKHTLFVAAIALFFLIAACEPFDGTAFDDNNTVVSMHFIGNDNRGIPLYITIRGRGPEPRTGDEYFIHALGRLPSFGTITITNANENNIRFNNEFVRALLFTGTLNNNKLTIPVFRYTSRPDYKSYRTLYDITASRNDNHDFNSRRFPLKFTGTWRNSDNSSAIGISHVLRDVASVLHPLSNYNTLHSWDLFFKQERTIKVIRTPLVGGGIEEIVDFAALEIYYFCTSYKFCTASERLALILTGGTGPFSLFCGKRLYSLHRLSKDFDG
ncbi:MAG: hypothetical protein FWC36_00275 [Spirochaetes bacterium]|nr:hypothetical protein [Spirochaetota bacterium]